MSAQPDTDRSLNAVKPVTEPDNKAAAEAAALANASPKPPSTNAPVDLSSLTREQLEARVKTLTESLSSASAESEYFREQWTELKLRDEALGVEALTVDQRKLEDGKVQAVKELYQSEMKRREALVLLTKLIASTELMLQTAPNYDPKVRADYEVASRAAKDYLGGHNAAAIPMASSLSDGRIADVKPDLNAVILNFGKTLGVKEGMTFLVYQGTDQVGAMKVVMAREQVSAAQITNLRANTVLKVGDRVAVDNGQ